MTNPCSTPTKVGRIFPSDMAMWLHLTVMAKLERNDPWQTAVAVALSIRHYEPPHGPQGIWFRNLTEAAKTEILGLGSTEIASLEECLYHLSKGRHIQDAGWRRELIDLCLRRDDIEAVRILFAQDGIKTSLLEEVTPLDWDAIRFVATMPPRLSKLAHKNPRLERNASTDHTAWWGAKFGR